MKVEIQEQRSLMKPSPKTTIPDDEDNEVNYNSLRKCSKKKHLSKHKSTSSTLASDSSQHRIAIIQELMSGSSSKKARRNLNFDENYLQCPEQEEEDEENGEDQEQGYEYEQEDFTQIQQQSQQLKCQQADDNLDITTVKINKPIAQVDTEKVEEFNLQDQQKQENNSDNTNLNKIVSDKNSNNVLSYSQSDSHQTNMLINPSELIGDISQNFMVCFSQIEGNHQTNSTQVFQNIVIDNSEIITSRNTDQVVLTNNDNDDINIDENIPLMKVDLQPISTETYQQLQETQEIVNEEQNHQSAGGESQGQDNQEAQEIIITKEDKNNCNSNKLEEEEEEMEEVERLLFNPVDDVNFIEDDQEDRFKEEYNSRQDDYGQFLNQENSLPFHQHFFNSEQENNSYNLSEKERTLNDNNNDPNNNISQPNSSQPILIPPQDTDSFAIPNSQTPQQPLSMEEQLASFEQDEMFGFDEEDKQILEQTEDFFLINADSLLNYRSTFTNFPQKRAILLDWMQEVSSSLSFKRETYQQSVQIMDRFFQQVPLIPKNKIQLVGATALVLAHKMEEVHIWKIEDFIMACNYGFTREQFLEMEQHIWQTLEYRLSCTPGYFWMNQLMLEWDVFSEQFEQLFENDVIFFRKNTQESFRMFSSVCQYLDSVLLNISSYNYSWNSLVASFMYWSLYQSIDITNHPVRLSYLDQIFEQFIANTLRIPSFQHMNLQLNFTSHYLNLNINTAIPTCKKECDPHSQNSNSSQTNNHYQSYENVCSQQIYNQDCLRLFSSA